MEEEGDLLYMRVECLKFDNKRDAAEIQRQCCGAPDPDSVLKISMRDPRPETFFSNQLCLLKTVLWVRIGFNADPDPAFHPDPGRVTKADPCGSGSGSWSDFEVTKSLIFL
jgi:hypothetical protein